MSRQAGDSRFWDTATPQDIGQVWQVARTWSEQGPTGRGVRGPGPVRGGPHVGLDIGALTASGDASGQSSGRSPRDLVQDLVNALSDQAAAHNERLDAELDRSVAGGLERIGQAQDATAGPGAAADERDLAAKVRETADGHDVRATADLDRAGNPDRAGEREAAATARLDAAAGFPMPTHEAIASKTGTKARGSRHPGAGASRDNDRSR